ncbi:MAG: hypothetical protein OEX02_08230 [Cyclobacteriaceae bacterium]|nr:hypothetical protein [Cyclobacteriaceae bacterium]
MKLFFAVVVLVFLLPFMGYSQKSMEFTAGAGATAVNLDLLVELDEVTGSYVTDWGVANYGLSGQMFIASKGNLGFGVELMYQYLYWYSVRIPYGTQPISREYSVGAIKITPILRIGTDKAFNVDVGPELNFSDGLRLGMLVSGNYFVPVSEKIDIPLKLRLDIINKVVATGALSVNGGIRIKM